MKYSLFLLLLLSSCAGYKFQERNNPFSDYGVNSISMPVFYNQSNFVNINSHITREVYKVLEGFKGLRIYAGKAKTDAILIGIVRSARRMSDSMSSDGYRSAKNATDGSLDTEIRDDFLIPTRSILSLNIDLYLIKNPTDKEIQLMNSSMGKFLVNSKVIINENIKISGSFIREVYKTQFSDITGTQNRGAKKATLKLMAEKIARSFKDNILYAF
jgi:hypothetical protein